MGLPTPTPRRGYFVVPTQETDALLQEPDDHDDSDLLRPPPTTNVPPPAHSTIYLEKSDYKDDRLIPRSALFYALFVALILMTMIIMLGRDTGTIETMEHDDVGKPPHGHHGSNAATLFPDIHEECHEYYSFARPMDHSAGYWSGAHDVEVLDQWALTQDPSICDTSLTYLLTPGYGLFYHLNAIAQAYSMAELTQRTFFIDDSEWDRGRWTDHFQPLPDPGCRKPNVSLVHSCPRASRHWALDPMTLHYHFGHEYQEEFSDPKSADVWRKKPMYRLARNGFTSILVPSDTTTSLIHLARSSLSNVTASTGGHYMGVHLRRGDRHPFSWFFHKDYIPLADFVEAIGKRWETARGNDNWLPEEPVLYVASASSTLASEFATLFPTGSSILSLSSSSSPLLSSLSSPLEYAQSTFNALPASERLSLTRGMMVDFDLLVGGWRLKGEEIVRGESRKRDGEGRKRPVAVVCTLSSNVCKMAAVALGWEEAVEEGRWINVDGGMDFDWGPTEVP